MKKSRKKKQNIQSLLKLCLVWSAMLLFLTLAIFLVNQNLATFEASIIPTMQAPAYDGLTMPIEKAPNWVALSTAEWKLPYSQIPASKLQKIPVYDPSKLKTPIENLKWGNPADDAIRNAKITYSVPYMGNYVLDGTEYSGSHLAVDIKIPKGTPVYAIGNGIIVKAAKQSSGFGNHIVIEHKNFPSYDNQNVKTTYYSSYSHLEDILVNEGSVVKKGDLIGHSGDSGLSTTPHLHFQIDKDSASWHPYWPFTSKEASDAGMNFTQAINQGLNKDRAIANTINPVMYVQKYLNATTSSTNTTTTTTTNINTPVTNTTSTNNNNTTSRTTTTTPANTNTTTSTTTNTPTNTETTTTTTDNNDDEPSRLNQTTKTNNSTDNSNSVTVENPTIEDINFEFDGDDSFKPGEKKVITVTAKLKNGDIIANFVPQTPLHVEVTKGNATISPENLDKNDFINGTAEITLTINNEQPVIVAIKLGDQELEDSRLMSPIVFADIARTHPNFQAISFLKNEGIIQGYADGTFQPDKYISRVEVLKIILEGVKADIQRAKSLPFKDTSINDWYADYVSSAITLGIVQGYSDGTFKPNANVNKVEFLKMLVLAMNIDIDPNVKPMAFNDVDENAWYAPYVQFAVEKNIFDNDSYEFNIEHKMHRDEIAEAIFRIQLLKKTGAETYTADLIDQAGIIPA